jgi:hydroxyethylthiazole kinase-like sugar kinase family protein
VTAVDVAAIRGNHAEYVRMHSHVGAFECCEAHTSADDVPALLAEVERLRAAMTGTADCAAETAEVCGDAHEFRSALLTASARLRTAVNP